MYLDDQEPPNPTDPFSGKLSELFRGFVIVGLSKDSKTPFFHGTFSDKASGDGLYGLCNPVRNWLSDQAKLMEESDSTDDFEF
jgi:hypothetical protein